jgi:uncharacterized protein YbbC (DUF1343 family)
MRADSILLKPNVISTKKTSHLVDFLKLNAMDVTKIFAPEHGFRGTADAGEHIVDGKDSKTGLPIISLYGDNRKPKPEQLEGIDILIFDIQDVGVRFYTYISTLHYVMESCAEQTKKLLVLDRPNPNANYIDGPILELPFKSFVGMHPVPIVYGMTIGEYAMMINGEAWLEKQLNCNLWVIPCINYTHETSYKLPVAPSPNLKSEQAIALYPSLCLFEATTVSVGRGTNTPFEVYGHPNFPKNYFSFTPISTVGAKNPPQINRLCYGFDLSKNQLERPNQINLDYLIQARDFLGDSILFIDNPNFFNLLSGNSSLQDQLLKGLSVKDIRETWKPGLDKFLDIRKKYLLYNCLSKLRNTIL